MNLFDVYPLFDIEPVKAEGCYVWDTNNTKYLDLYGGHAVISIGHSHPHYIKRLTEQVNKIGFYSNSVQNSMQKEMAEKLGQLASMEEYSFFFCNSGAEANENAFKLASFHTGKKKVISYSKGFHGRTSGAVATTDNAKIVAPFNANHNVEILPFNDLTKTEEALKKGDVCAVIVEGIQGIGGIIVPNPDFLEGLEKLCKQYDAVLILDEIQSGYGRSGKFFAFQYTNIKPDIVTVAKGMGNGFPLGGVLISPKFTPWFGMLGTTFGGNYLACASGLAVLEVMKQENLVENSSQIGQYLIEQLQSRFKVKEVRGIGLMIGIEFEQEIKEIRRALLFEKHIFTGVSGAHTIRLLPPLTMTKEMADTFLNSLEEVLNKIA